ncbi:MAG: VOC family protein [Bacteroidaceae bacterium]|nr:VOC family protein [Bacteroidaceae bacterium]
MRIEHIAINVRNLEQTCNFFVHYFGAQSNADYHNPITGLRSYFLTFDSGARLEIMNWPNMHGGDFDKHLYGYTHICMSIGSREAVDELTARLIADGYRHVSGPRVTGEGYYESCILLDEGEELELTI